MVLWAGLSFNLHHVKSELLLDIDMRVKISILHPPFRYLPPFCCASCACTLLLSSFFGPCQAVVYSVVFLCRMAIYTFVSWALIALYAPAGSTCFASGQGMLVLGVTGYKCFARMPMYLFAQVLECRE